MVTFLCLGLPAARVGGEAGTGEYLCDVCVLGM